MEFGLNLCSECGHAAEGFAADESLNRRRAKKGLPLLRPSCSSGFDTGMTGVQECGCQHTAHSEYLVSWYRILR